MLLAQSKRSRTFAVRSLAHGFYAIIYMFRWVCGARMFAFCRHPRFYVFSLCFFYGTHKNPRTRVRNRNRNRMYIYLAPNAWFTCAPLPIL